MIRPKALKEEKCTGFGLGRPGIDRIPVAVAGGRHPANAPLPEAAP
jgi:hypothetical protein